MGAAIGGCRVLRCDMQLAGFASDGMRAFVDAFGIIYNAGAPVRRETVWRLCGASIFWCSIFEAPGSDYDPGRANRAARFSR